MEEKGGGNIWGDEMSGFCPRKKPGGGGCGAPKGLWGKLGKVGPAFCLTSFSTKQACLGRFHTFAANDRTHGII